MRGKVRERLVKGRRERDSKRVWPIEKRESKSVINSEEWERDQFRKKDKETNWGDRELEREELWEKVQELAKDGEGEWCINNENKNKVWYLANALTLANCWSVFVKCWFIKTQLVVKCGIRVL